MPESPITEPELPPCDYCGSHRDPAKQVWAAWVEPSDYEGEPARSLTVAKTNGKHVAEADAIWIRSVLNDRPMDVNP